MDLPIAPPPVDLSRLAGFLKKSKEIIKQDVIPDTRRQEVPISESRNVAFNEDDDNNDKFNDAIAKRTPSRVNEGTYNDPSQTSIPKFDNISVDQIKNSNLPSFIKESFINKPISIPKQGNSLAGLEDLIEKPKSLQQQQRPKQIVTENKQTSSNLTESEIRKIVKEEMMDFLGKYLVKNLTESIQRKTVQQQKNKKPI